MLRRCTIFLRNRLSAPKNGEVHVRLAAHPFSPPAPFSAAGGSISGLFLYLHQVGSTTIFQLPASVDLASSPAINRDRLRMQELRQTHLVTRGKLSLRELTRNAVTTSRVFLFSAGTPSGLWNAYTRLHKTFLYSRFSSCGGTHVPGSAR